MPPASSSSANPRMGEASGGAEWAEGAGGAGCPARCPVDARRDLQEDLAILPPGPVAYTHSGQEVQRISVINNLPDLLKDHHDDCMRRVVPKVREVLHVAQAEMQVAACKAFLHVLQGNLIPLHNYSNSFLQSILMAIDSKDPDVANAWLETLLDVIDLLPKDVIKRDILSIAIAKGQLSQSVQSRLSCCRILGKIATKFEPFVIKKDILPIVQSLCQDVDYEVRGCMCRQLDPVARGLGLESTKNTILPELVELAKDEESFVRLAGLETVVHLLSLLDDETCSSTIVPLVCKFCQQALSTEDSTLPLVAKQIGKLCHGLSVNLTEEQRHWFVGYYKKLCKIGLSKSGHEEREPEKHSTEKLAQMAMLPVELLEEEDQNVECRKNAAYNFPAMVLFAGVRNFKSELLVTFSDMCSDPSHAVRKSSASGLHEVVKLLGNNGFLLQSELIMLLRDDHTEVLDGVVNHLPETLETIARGIGVHVSDSKSQLLSDLVPALLHCEAVIASSHHWRLQADFIEKLTCIVTCFSSDHIYHKFIPLLFRKFHTARALPVKHAVVKTMLFLLKHTKKQEHRNEMCRRLVEDVCRADSCYRRMLFVDVSITAMELFSRNFFKLHFFEALLELATDPVPNVRLRVCPLLPKLKRHIKLPSDRQLLQLLETNVRKLLLNEKDPDVMTAIQSAVEELDRTQVQMESLTKKAFLEEDIADLKKEEDERKLIELEEKEKKEDEGKSVKGERRSKESRSKESNSSKTTGPKRGSKIPTATSTTGKEKHSAPASRHNGTHPSSREKLTSSSKEKASSKSRTRLSTSPRPSHRSAANSASSSGSRKGSASSVSSTSSISSLSSAASSSSASQARRGSTGSSGKGEIKRASRDRVNLATEPSSRKKSVH